MRSVIVAVILSLLVTGGVFGACTNPIVINTAGTSATGETLAVAGAVFITFSPQTADCTQTVPALRAGDALTIVAGERQFSASVTSVDASANFTRVQALAAGPAAEDEDTLNLLTTGTAAKIEIGNDTFDGTIVNPKEALQNVTRYEWSIGPATKSAHAGTNTASAATPDAGEDGGESAEGAFRLQYEGVYARPGFFGRGTAASRFHTIATLNIDTTNSDDPGYIDDNRATLGFRSVELRTPSFLAQTRVGVATRLTRSFHAEAQDSDIVLTASSWIPALRSRTLFSSVPDYISPPLAVTLSYGYRNKEVPGSADSSGRSGEATATYYLYAFDKYQVTLSGKWTLNDMSNRPADVNRTTRLYKIAVAYLTDPAKGFEVVTSFENGHVGPLLTKVRQYYVGIATKKFSLAGGSK